MEVKRTHLERALALLLQVSGLEDEMDQRALARIARRHVQAAYGAA